MAEPLDTGRAHPARVYDVLLGGRDNFAADRAAAARGLEVNPNAAIAPRQNRAFLRRVVRYLAGQGIRQFLDLGSGLPTSPNVHEVAQAADPSSRVVYVDHDPIVLAHARTLLTSTAQGRTAYVEGDLRQVEQILAAPGLRAVLDLEQPVGVLLFAVLHFLGDDTDPYGIVRRLMAAVPRGSHLALSHLTANYDPVSWAKFAEVMRRQGITTRLRGRAEVAGFFDGLDLVDPGVVPILRWRPEETVPFSDAQVSLYGGVARKL